MDMVWIYDVAAGPMTILRIGNHSAPPMQGGQMMRVTHNKLPAPFQKTMVKMNLVALQLKMGSMHFHWQTLNLLSHLGMTPSKG